MKPFRFKQFSLNQSDKVFRIGTDGVLLGILCSIKNADKILEVGSGSGLISLMIAQRNSIAEIFAIDFDEAAVELTKENFLNSPFSKRLQVEKHNFKSFETSLKFDFIISNPPYFVKNLSTKDIAARQQTELSFDDLINTSVQILAKNGKLGVIIPFDCEEYFTERCSNHGLYLCRKVTIFGVKYSKPKRCVLEYSFEKEEVIECEFVIEKSPRKYSDEYLRLTRDFHVFDA